MEITLSHKYQIIIPRLDRNSLGLKPGQKLWISRVNKKLVIDTQSVVDKYAGKLADGWSGEDAAKSIRLVRDNDRT